MAGDQLKAANDLGVPEFYTRDEKGIPRAWVKGMRNSMAQLTPPRAVREYTERYYLPAAIAYRARASRQGKLGEKMADWRRGLDRRWGLVRFGDAEVETVEGQHTFTVEAHLGELGPDAVRAELYAEATGDEDPVGEPMVCTDAPSGPDSCFAFTVSVPAARPAPDFTVRLLPNYPGVSRCYLKRRTSSGSDKPMLAERVSTEITKLRQRVASVWNEAGRFLTVE